MLIKKVKGNTLLLDGKYLAYRTFYSFGLNNLTYNGMKTGIFFGFLNTIKSVVKKFSPVTNIYLFWDIRSKKDVRRELFPEYKKKKTNKDKIEEKKLFHSLYMELVEECDGIGFKGNHIDGFEADDMIAFYCMVHGERPIIIITRDEDMYQCLKPNVAMFSPDDKVLKTQEWFERKYGIRTTQWKNVKKIAGCSSDGVPGVAGIGETRALQYIKKECSETIKNKIEKEQDLILRNLKLVSLPHEKLAKRNKKDIKFYPVSLDMDAFLTFCQIYGLNSFLENDLTFWKKLCK